MVFGSVNHIYSIISHKKIQQCKVGGTKQSGDRTIMS